MSEYSIKKQDLDIFLKKNKIKISTLAEVLGISSNTLVKRKGLRKTEAIIFLKWTGANPKTFNLPIDFCEIEPLNLEQEEKVNLLLSYNTQNIKGRTDESFIDEYFKVFGNIVSNIKTNFTILEYYITPDMVRLKVDEKQYDKSSKTYFKKLTNRLILQNDQQKKFRYTRAIGLPIRTQNPHFFKQLFYDDGKGVISKAGTKYFIEFSLEQKFKHIVSCFTKLKDSFEFYVSHYPFKYYSVYMTNISSDNDISKIDNISTLISEYYRYDAKGNERIDLVFTETAQNDKTKKLISNHLFDYRKIKAYFEKNESKVEQNPTIEKPTLNDFLWIFEELFNRLMNEKKNLLDQKYKIKNNNFKELSNYDNQIAKLNQRIELLSKKRKYLVSEELLN